MKELNLPLKHNQLIVARNFGLMREDDRYWCKDLISEGMADHRWMLLTAEVRIKNPYSDHYIGKFTFAFKSVYTKITAIGCGDIHVYISPKVFFLYNGLHGFHGCELKNRLQLT